LEAQHPDFDIKLLFFITDAVDKKPGVFVHDEPFLSCLSKTRSLSLKWFCIGATFEMRTVLYEIHLFNDKVIMHDSFSYQNKLCGERARQ